MTAEAHAHVRFRRANERRALWAAEDAARELSNLLLEAALQLVAMEARQELASYLRIWEQDLEAGGSDYDDSERGPASSSATRLPRRWRRASRTMATPAFVEGRASASSKAA